MVAFLFVGLVAYRSDPASSVELAAKTFEMADTRDNVSNDTAPLAIDVR